MAPPSDLRKPAGTVARVDCRSPSTGSAAVAGSPTGVPSPALPKVEPGRNVQMTAAEAGSAPAQQRVADAALKVDRELVASLPCGQDLGETGQGQGTLFKYSEYVAVPGVPECRAMISRRGNSQRTDPRWYGMHQMLPVARRLRTPLCAGKLEEPFATELARSRRPVCSVSRKLPL